MADNGEHPEPIADEEPQVQIQQASDNQHGNRNVLRAIIILAIGNIGGAGIAGLVSKVVDPPYNILAVVLGIACLLVANSFGIHDLLGRDGKLIAGLCTIGLILDVVFGLVTYESFLAKSSVPLRSEKVVIIQQPAATPTLEQPTFPEDENVVTIHMGGNTTRYPSAQFRHGMVSIAPLFINSTFPLALSIEGGRLFVDATLTSAEPPPNRVVVIKHNFLVAEPPTWDHNSNNVALEFVDEKESPVFQLIYRRPNDLIINGIFQLSGGNSLFVNEEGAAINPTKVVQPFLTPIFKYPSWKFRGKYAGSN